MLDYLSERPAPPKNIAIKNLVETISKDYENININIIEDITTSYINDMPLEKMGSFSGWVMFGQIEAKKNISKLIDLKIHISKYIIYKFMIKYVYVEDVD